MPLFDDTAPPNTEGVKLGAQRIREAKTLLNSTLGLIFSAANTFLNNVLPGATLQNNTLTGTQLQSDPTVDANRAVGTNHLKDSAVTAPKLASTAFSDGLAKVLTTDPVTVAADGVTLGFDTSTPKKLKVMDKGIGSAQFADNALAGAYVLIHDEKAIGTAGGIPVTASPFYTVRDANTIKVDLAGVCSLNTQAGSNRIQLLPGTYRCRISAPGFQVGNHRIVLWNVTSGDDILLVAGANESNSGSGQFAQTRAWLTGRFILPSTGNLVSGKKELQIRHFVASSPGAAYGLGQISAFSNNQLIALGFTPPNGPPEIYTVAEFWKDA